MATLFAIIQNDPDVPPGSCATLLDAAGAPYRLCLAWLEPLPDPGSLTGALVLGGSMGVHEVERFPYLASVAHFVAESLRLQLPLLGICLGGQLLAQVAGGSVTAASPHGEKGSLPVSLTPDGSTDPLFAAVPATFTTFQWHDDSFLPPAGARLLASSPRCPWQAFRFGGNAYGVQFHPEVDRAIVSDWSSGDAGCLASFDAVRPQLEAHCHAILANFIRIAIETRRP